MTTVIARNGVIYPSLQIAGFIIPFRQVGIASDLAEPIADVDVQEGDHVRAGQVLARLVTDDLQAQLSSAERMVAEDIAHYNQTAYQTQAVNGQDTSAINSARAALRSAQVTLAGAQTDLQRYQSLASQGYLPAQTLQEQQTTVASDEQAVSSDEAALAQAVANAASNGSGTTAGQQQESLAAAREAVAAAQASVRQLRSQIARATITSPAAGVVDAVNANPGEYPSGRELFTIDQLGDVYALLPASSAQAVQIRQGAAATITVTGTNREDRGTVSAVLDQIQPGTTNFSVKVLIANADGHLHAGMPVVGNVSLPAVRGIVVPVTAFVDDTHASVYVVSNGVVETRQVSEVQTDGTNSVVTGLPAGSTVVENVDQTTIGNGDHVEAQP